MMCYRDQTFCSFYVNCEHGKTCGRALTPEVEKAAEIWWGGEGAPICEFVDRPDCVKLRVTVWERLDEKTGRYKHNHIEDGWSENAAPTPVSDEQKKSWKNADWRRIHAFLEHNVI